MLARIGQWIGKIADRRSSTLLASVAVMVVFGCFSYFVDMTMQDIGVKAELHAGAQATLVGVGTGLAALVVLLARKERHDATRRELERVAELNHRLRNSLEVLSASHYLASDELQKKLILETVSSIEVAMRQLFPSVQWRERVPPQVPPPSAHPRRQA